MPDATVKLIDIRCDCGKLLGKVERGAAHEHKCPRCKTMTIYRFGEFTTEVYNEEAFGRL
jgi:phage FluMu protein Com